MCCLAGGGSVVINSPIQIVSIKMKYLVLLCSCLSTGIMMMMMMIKMMMMMISSGWCQTDADPRPLPQHFFPNLAGLALTPTDQPAQAEEAEQGEQAQRDPPRLLLSSILKPFRQSLASGIPVLPELPLQYGGYPGYYPAYPGYPAGYLTKKPAFTAFSTLPIESLTKDSVLPAEYLANPPAIPGLPAGFYPAPPVGFYPRYNYFPHLNVPAPKPNGENSEA